MCGNKSLEKVFCFCYNHTHAGMVKLANTPDLGSGGAILAGSSPVTRTKKGLLLQAFFLCFLF